MVSAGRDHNCAVTMEGGVKCWGSNRLGLLGDGKDINRSTPVIPIGLTGGVSSVSAGTRHTCALTTQGQVRCWTQFELDTVAMESGVAAVAVGSDHTCFVTVEGGIKCFGDNRYGALGDGTGEYSVIPVDVSGFSADGR